MPRLGADPCIPVTHDIAPWPLQLTAHNHKVNDSTSTIPPHPTATPYVAPPDYENMADLPAASPGPAGAETPAQEKARLRRERLAAKSGAARLQQISALQGGPPKDLSEIQKDLPGMCGL